jgi:hypothetical protein
MSVLNDEQIKDAQLQANAAHADPRIDLVKKGEIHVDEFLASLNEDNKYFDSRAATGRTKYGDLVFKLFLEGIKK